MPLSGCRSRGRLHVGFLSRLSLLSGLQMRLENVGNAVAEAVDGHPSDRRPTCSRRVASRLYALGIWSIDFLYEVCPCAGEGR